MIRPIDHVRLVIFRVGRHRDSVLESRTLVIRTQSTFVCQFRVVLALVQLELDYVLHLGPVAIFPRQGARRVLDDHVALVPHALWRVRCGARAQLQILGRTEQVSPGS